MRNPFRVSNRFPGPNRVCKTPKCHVIYQSYKTNIDQERIVALHLQEILSTAALSLCGASFVLQKPSISLSLPASLTLSLSRARALALSLSLTPGESTAC